jgi:hypothetical protein
MSEMKELLIANLTLLEKAVSEEDLRLIQRVLRNNTTIRRNISPALLHEAVCAYFPEDAEFRNVITSALSEFPKVYVNFVYFSHVYTVFEGRRYGT